MSGAWSCSTSTRLGTAHRRLHHYLRGLPRDGAARGPLSADFQQASPVRGEAAQNHSGWGVCPAEEAEDISPLPRVLPYDSNWGWHGEWFYIRNLTEAPFPTFTEKRLERRKSWSWGPAGRQNKLEIIEIELWRLVRHGLDPRFSFSEIKIYRGHR